jgi:isopentenyldiphosphate isomerase
MVKQFENVEVYDLKGNLVGVQNRTKFYAQVQKEYAAKGKITKQVRTIRLLLMNSNGRIYIQKRSMDKPENPGLYDKTIGGHVVAGHTWYMTVVKECHEELGFPAVVLSHEEFRQAINSTDTGVIGIFRQVDSLVNYLSVRKTKTKDFVQPQMTNVYIGYYDGPIHFKDGESTGVEVFTLAELEKEMAANPKRFTEDLKFMIKKYRKYLVPVAKLSSTF